MRNKKNLSDELSKLLMLKATEEEMQQLSDMGIEIKNPTRMTVIAASLYTKASNGDLSAIKELISVIGTEKDRQLGGVTLVNDIGKP